jgi:hypothetical protein
MVVNATLLGFHRKGKEGMFLLLAVMDYSFHQPILMILILVLFGEPLIVSTDRQDTPL